MLDSLFGNPMIKKMAFGTLSKTMKEKDLTLIGIVRDETKDEGFDIVFFNEPVEIIRASDLQELRDFAAQKLESNGLE